MNNMNNINNANNTYVMRENLAKERYLRGNKAKIQLAKVAAALMIVTALILAWLLSEEPEIRRAREWAYDDDMILLPSVTEKINSDNRDLYYMYNEEPEIIVVIEKENGENRNLAKRAEKLFKEYNVSEYGMLFMVSVPDNAADSDNLIGRIGKGIGEYFGNLFGGDRTHRAIYVGDKVDGSLKRMTKSILNDRDNFDSSYYLGNYDEAVLSTFNALFAELQRYYAETDDTNNALPTLPIIPSVPIPPVTAEDIVEYSEHYKYR